MKQLTPQTFRLTLLALALFSQLNLEALGQTRVTKSTRQVVAKSSRPSGESGETKRIRVLALRLRPGDDLRKQLELFVKENRIRAGFLITAVGSLRQASIRLADQPAATNFEGKFEIVSLVGTLGDDGVHLHVSISDNTGKTVGGHLVDGCLIYTTAEIVIGDAEGLIFSREKDAETGYQELRIRRNSRSQKQ